MPDMTSNHRDCRLVPDSVTVLSSLPRYCRFSQFRGIKKSIGNPVPRFAAGLFEQTDIFDDHAAVSGFAHVVDGQEAHGNRSERLHFDTSAAHSLSRDLDCDAMLAGVEREFGGDTGQRQRMA